MIDAVAFKEEVKAAVDKWRKNHHAPTEESKDPITEQGIAPLVEKLKTLQERALKNFNDNSAKLPPSAKKPKISGQGAAESAKGPQKQKKQQQKQQGRTLKDVALLILDNCKDGEDLKTLGIVTIKDFLRLKKCGSWEKLKDQVSSCDDDEIENVFFRSDNYAADPDKAYSRVEQMFSPLAALQGALKSLIESKQASREEGIMQWNADLVVTEPRQHNIKFPTSLEKCSAMVITGESGSGKSWFAKKFLPYKFKRASFIYHELDDNDADFSTCKPQDEELGRIYQDVLRCLYSDGYMSAVAGDSKVQSWWHQPTHMYDMLEELGIIIDEIGKAPNLARGLVDEVRNISLDIRHRGLAKNVMLILVGAGLDHVIGRDSISFEAQTPADVEEIAIHTKFGTDQSKSQVTYLKGPDLKSRDKIYGIPVEDIMNGTYSQVLATNTRMLTRGVIPVLNSRFNSLRVDDMSLRRVELGSTNIVMDFAARVYIDLNGLASLGQKKRDALLLKQFRLLEYGETRNLESDEVKSAMDLNPSFTQVLRRGLVTSDIRSTSRALRYLACKGQTAPLHAQDGVAFEIVLQNHLVRSSRADYVCGWEEDTRQNPGFFCGRYALAQAWPPSSTKKNGLGTEDNVKHEVVSRYSNERTKKRPRVDAIKIASLLKNKTEYDLVLRQTVGNVQGADVLVLGKRKNSEATLDLYQAKHYNKIPALASKETTGAFASLGVVYNSKEKSFDTEPKTGSAGYSSLGTAVFVKELSDALGIPVQLGKRVVVFSEGLETFSKSKSWKDFDFKAAASKNVWIWTREMLEPTVSALVTGPAVEVSDEGSD